MAEQLEGFPQRRHLVLKLILKLLAVLYLLANILGGIGLGWLALHPYSAQITPNEEKAAQEEFDRRVLNWFAIHSSPLTH